MSFTAQAVLTEVRDLVQDSMGPDYRYSDPFVLRKIDQIVRGMAIIRPDLFIHFADITCAAGALQEAPADSVRLVDVLRNKNGQSLKEINQEALDLLSPGWPGQSAAAATNWMRYPRAPNRFYVFPPATAGDALSIAYARCVPVTALGDTIALQDAYLSTVVNGTVWLLESVDAEHTESGRAKMYKDAYDSALAAGLTTRQITDDPAAGGSSTK
jgi:hypothetical protein